jgi:light-regulated signal transduction histidine kinase (bacteriophytochrome)
VADDHVLKHNLDDLAPTIERALHLRAKREAQAELAIGRLAELEASSSEMEEFTHVIAQDLQTPLRHIESFTELLNKSASDRLDEKCKTYLKTIGDSAHHMAKLIDDLFAFSRIGRTEMYRLPIGLKDIVNEVIHDLRHEIEGRSVEWVVDELPEVTGDPVLLWQVMTNLLSNALKFTRPREHARIEIASSATAKEFVISVRDNGIGFDNHHADKLFGVFKRLHREEFEGTGVGLVNVRRIIKRHGGRVWAEGVEGQGATFFFSLPRTEKPEA